MVRKLKKKKSVESYNVLDMLDRNMDFEFTNNGISLGTDRLVLGPDNLLAFAHWIDIICKCYDETHPLYYKEGAVGVRVEGSFKEFTGFLEWFNVSYPGIKK